MAVVGVTHAKVVLVPDDGTSPVGSDEWNAGHVITGLENVDNTSDVNKPVSTAQAAALANKVAGPASAVDDLPAIFDGTTGKLIKSKTYAAFKALLALVKGDVGLGNVDNTSDVNKPVSTAQAAADALKSSSVSPQGRLTLTSGTPVMATSVAAATTVYYTPAAGNQVPLYDGINMVPTSFAEISQTTTDTTKSPAAVAASSLYDIFVWNDAGTIRATRGPAWTNATTRSAALVSVNGILLNSASVTNGPAAQRGTYVGTIGSNASSTIDYVFGLAGTAANFGVWNAYNRVAVASTCSENTVSWTYTLLTPRAPNAGTASRATFVSGLALDGIDASYFTKVILAAANASGGVGVSLDGSTSDKQASFLGAINGQSSVLVRNTYLPQLGRHFVQALEFGDNTNANTFTGTNQAGLTVTLRA